MDQTLNYHIQKAKLQSLNHIDDSHEIAQACAILASCTPNDDQWEQTRRALQERYYVDIQSIMSEPLVLTRIERKLSLIYDVFDNFLQLYQNHDTRQSYAEYCYIDVLVESLIEDLNNIPGSETIDMDSPVLQDYDVRFDDVNLDICIAIFQEQYYRKSITTMNNTDLCYYLCNIYYLINAGFFIYNRIYA